MYLDLVGPLQDSRIDDHTAVEGVVLEVWMQVQFVTIWGDLLGKTTLGDELLFLR